MEVKYNYESDRFLSTLYNSSQIISSSIHETGVKLQNSFRDKPFDSSSNLTKSKSKGRRKSKQRLRSRLRSRRRKGSRISARKTSKQRKENIIEMNNSKNEKFITMEDISPL